MDREEALRRIRSDRSSGAAELLRRAADVFPLLRGETVESIEDARRLVVDTCRALTEAQPYMAGIANLADSVKRAVADADASQAIEKAALAAREFVEKAATAAERTAELTSAQIPENATVLTHSRSSTVLNAFVRARRAGRRFGVIATESRPLFEGRAVAETLAREGIAVTLIADAAAALVMERADLIMVGADRVTPEYVVNKIGTRMIALAANEVLVPVHAITDLSKFTRETMLPERPDLQGPGDLWRDRPSDVQVINRLFEPTPLALFTTIITEDGALTNQQAAYRAAISGADQE